MSDVYKICENIVNEKYPIKKAMENKNYILGNLLPMSKHAIEKYFSVLKKGSHRYRKNDTNKFGFIPENFRLYEMYDSKLVHYEENLSEAKNKFSMRIL
jgi:hypothetical protein